MNLEFTFTNEEKRTAEHRRVAREYRLVSFRECPLPESLTQCVEASAAARYWRENVATHPLYNSDVECFVILLLNTRKRIKGHVLISTGTLDSILVHPREVFRPAIIGAAGSIILMHNHPSGETEPSEADIRVTRDLVRAGQLLKLEVLDHVIVGAGESFKSLKEMGYFYV